MERNGSSFEARNSAWRLILLALLAAAFVVLGLWMIGIFGSDHPEGAKAMLAGWSSIILFGACVPVILWRLRDQSVVLRVDAGGIYCKRLSTATIPWSVIGEMATLSIRRQKFIGFKLTDQRVVPQSGLREKLAAANEALTGYPLSLGVTGTDRTFPELLAAVERLKPE